MGNLCCDSEEEEECTEENLIRNAILELRQQLKTHQRNNPVETDVSVKWKREYTKTITSLELILNKIMMDKTMKKVPVKINVDYRLHECPKIEEMEGINLPIPPNSLL
jgi:hypothetical protein